MKMYQNHQTDRKTTPWGKILTTICFGTVILILSGCSKTPDEQYALGRRYYKGDGVETNRAEAVKWYRKAAERGHAGAQFALGTCYCYGEGVEKNHAEAVKWWRKAADQGQKEAQFNLGLSCYNGDGVEKNHAEAVKWWRKAAEQGHGDAQFNLGLCCYNGDGAEKNHAEAVKWWRAAAEQGIVKAQANLGECYYHGDGIEKNRAEAVYWWRKAAEKGNTAAKLNVGVCYHNGDGVARNIAEAVYWWRRAASDGNKMAAKLLQKPWEELRSKSVLGVRFGSVFNPEKREPVFFRMQDQALEKLDPTDSTDSYACFKIDNYSRKKGDWADAVGVSITPKSHKVFRIIGVVINAKERSNIKALLEDRFYAKMNKFVADKYLDLYDYRILHEEFSIRIFFDELDIGGGRAFFHSIHLISAPVFVVFTDRKLERQAKLEAGGKKEGEIWGNNEI